MRRNIGVIVVSLAALIAAVCTTILVREMLPCREFHRSEADLRKGQWWVAAAHLQRAADASVFSTRGLLCRAKARAALETAPVDGLSDPQQVERALDDFNGVLKREPDNIDALHGAAGLLFTIGNKEGAESYYRRALAIRPDAETYAALGIIQWNKAYRRRMEVASKLGLQFDNSPAFIKRPECQTVRDEVRADVGEALRLLANARETDPQNLDAIAYMNLICREQANIQCGDEKAYSELIRQANGWTDLWMKQSTANFEAATSSAARH